MTNVVNFPQRPNIRVISGTTVETGEPVYLLELVEGQSQNIVAEYASLVDLAYAILEWESDGVPVIRSPGGAA